MNLKIYLQNIQNDRLWSPETFIITLLRGPDVVDRPAPLVEDNGGLQSFTALLGD